MGEGLIFGIWPMCKVANQEGPAGRHKVVKRWVLAEFAAEGRVPNVQLALQVLVEGSSLAGFVISFGVRPVTWVARIAILYR